MIPNIKDENKEFKNLLLDLLAVLHRDGGHYTANHGIEKSIKEAKIKYLTAVHKIDEEG